MTQHQPKYRDIDIVNVTFGKDVTVIRPCNLYGCTLGDGCFIGPFVEIQRNVNIGVRTRVQSHSFICELVTIGGDCFIGHGVMFINDRFAHGRPAYDERELWLPTTLGDRISVGSNATILPVTICDDVVIGAGSVVTQDINRPGIYLGSPAVFVRGFDKSSKKYFTGQSE